MRPVRRPACTRALSAPAQARDLLIDAIGDACSYCETPFQASVEHILPWEDKYTALELVWDNFLLTCQTCNNFKKNRQFEKAGEPSQPLPDAPTARARHLWPDRDNTARAFTYTPDNRVSVASGLNHAERELAERTHHLFGFDKESASDLRWRRRKSGWTVAEIQRASVLANPSSTNRDDVEKQLAHVGFWSVWRVVFANDVDMLQRLNRAFRGTADDCFEPGAMGLVARPGGQL